MSLEVRAMTTADIPAALQLWSATDGVEVAEGDGPADIGRYLARNPGFSSVAEVAGRLVAAVLCGHDGRRGFVYHLAVAADHRRRGIAGEVMRRSLRELKTAGIARALLLVARDNPGGQTFWLNEGWDDMTFARPMGIDL